MRAYTSSRSSSILWVIPALSLLLFAGCDTSGSNEPSPSEDDSTDTNTPPYTSTTVSGSSDTLSLPDTLLLPNTSATVPGVVLIHGSGPLSRNGQDPSDSIPPIYERWAERPVSNNLICGAGATFWRQWIRHSQKADSVAAAVEDPLFVQQGRADQNYPNPTLERNVTAWRRIAQAGNASVQTYQGVTHLFLNTDTSTTADAPLSDLIDWIQTH